MILGWPEPVNVRSKQACCWQTVLTRSTTAQLSLLSDWQQSLSSSKPASFEACAREYYLAHAGNWKNAKHASQWINTMAQYVFPKLGSMPVKAVGKAKILKAVAPRWDTKAETASRVLQRIRTAIN
jgi:hypothetical protein